MTSREKFEAWWEQEKYDDKLSYITGIMFNRIKANMFLSWEAASREQEQKLTDMAVQLANAESKCRELSSKAMELVCEASLVYSKYNDTQMPDRDLVDMQTLQEMHDLCKGAAL